ncbi:MAG: RHS repeat-associated core domain-containing protein, partial [Bacteroidales bacterium]|nr:RHS repeat-associated core domain-containing protein [Bacteroidales bacterium]
MHSTLTLAGGPEKVWIIGSGKRSIIYPFRQPDDDANGNLTYDGRQDLDIRWNIFNLASGAETHDGGSLTLARLSDGTLFAQQKENGGNTTGKRYCGSFVFTTGTGNTTPQVESVAWDEGRIFADAAGNYHDCWFAGDHLGNVRSVLDITPDVTVPIPLEQNDYLPFGTKIANPLHVQMNTNRWRDAGKEEFPDLNQLDFGARMYDPFTARWTAVDPMARGCSHISSYAYCYGNPLRYADPNGCDGLDKTVGYAIGFITNIVPGSSSLRDLYSQNDPEDYNGALKSSDDAAMLVGEALSKGGMLMTGTGSAVTGVGVVMMGTGGGIMLSGVGTPEGGAVFVGGAKVATVGAEATAVGVTSTAAGVGLMLNSRANSSQGYGRGKTGSSTKPKKSYQLNREIEQGKVPENILRFDPGNPDHGEKPHVHFKDGSALNKDGSW